GGGGSNFIDLSVSPATMSVGTGINLAFTCNAGLFNYQGVPVDVYWVIVVNPSISDQAATVDQLLSSGTVYYFSPPNKRGQMLMTSKLKGPSFPGVVLSTPTYSGTLTVNLGSNAGTFAFAMGFINRNTGALVGNITEVSNAFTLKRP
ncbi:MAG: hypothetical protein NT045_00365, partial [Candidatus Aureabacteria bacterium]|nr:hypothetical protein [Candidatus Auribacterota bacterium]